MKDVRYLVADDSEKILERIDESGVYKVLIIGATLVSSPNQIDDELVVGVGSHGQAYRVDSEDVTISSDGTIEFEALDAKYVIRDVTEDDDLSNLNPETEEEEE